MSNFENCVPSMSHRYTTRDKYGTTNKAYKKASRLLPATDPMPWEDHKKRSKLGGHLANHAPLKEDWFADDDTLERQGQEKDRKKGHGICKGVSTAWVVAFMSGVRDATAPDLFNTYYKNYLRFQATMIKDYGDHIPQHLEQFAKIGMPTTLREYRVFEKEAFEIRDGHMHAQWAAYCSVWHHDIAFGSSHGSTGPYYIVEPNTGLLGYTSCSPFLSDLNKYIEKRRSDKNLDGAKAGFWVYI